MLVGLLRAAAVAALCLTAVAHPAEAKQSSHSSLRKLGEQKPIADLQDAGSFVMPYKDATINLNWNTNVISTMVGGSRVALVDDMKSAGINSVVLAFATGECGSESWGGVSAAGMRAGNMAAFKSSGIKFRLSTGGASGSFSCGSQAGFDAFVSGWVDAGLVGVDFDIESGQSASTVAALVSRVKEALPKYPNLVFTFTVAVLAQSVPGSRYATPFPSGQAPDPFAGGAGATTLNAIIQGLGFQQGNPSSWPDARVRINPMTMDYGTASANVCVVGDSGKCQMAQSAIQAAYNLNGHWGVPLSAIELTPMIGDNDTADEIFTLADAATVATWAKKNGLAAVHHWSYDRDTPCGTAMASPTCNNVAGTKPHSYTQAFQQAESRADAIIKQL